MNLIPKFYELEDITQEYLNEIELERYIFIKEIERLNNIIKEARNYIIEESWFCYKDNEEVIDRTPIDKLLEILDEEK